MAAKKPMKEMNFDELKNSLANALDQLVEEGEGYACAVACSLHELIDRLRNQPAMMKASKPAKCGPGGERDHSACCHEALEASMETTALLLHACCCCDGDYE